MHGATMSEPTWRQALAWVVLWVAMVIVVAFALPGEQSWWAGSITIVLTGIDTAASCFPSSEVPMTDHDADGLAALLRN
jgi:hypothetical protein